MFRRRPNTLPSDPVFEPKLDKLGFFVNEHDQIRMIRNPEAKYTFKVNSNERVNYVYRQACNTAISKIVRDRLAALSLETVRLPLGAGPDEKHIPILVTKDIASKVRVIVLFGERHQEPGVFSWRVVGGEGINIGSAVELASAAMFGPTPTPAHSAPGIIVANPCQLLWYRGGGRAVSSNEWLNLPRDSAVNEPFKIDDAKNRVLGNGDYEEHVRYVFEEVLPQLVRKEAKIDFMGIEYPGSTVIEYLANHWDAWSTRVTGIALIAPQHKVQDLEANGVSEEFLDFLSKRVRAYFVSPEKLETAITGRDMFGCNCYASGESMYQENAIVRSWRSILDWFNRLYADPEFEEVPFAGVDGDEGAGELQLTW
ncbi:hypothetical protein LTS15_004870 [Exophiala xenobiotica]|nr:hypothetical protein LTS15_004870 [Exophiala xenobiotica]